MRYSALRAAIFLVIGLAFAVSASAEVVFDSVRSGVVHIGEAQPQGNPKWLGTGFLVDAHCTFATARHILAGAARDKIVIRFQLPPEWKRVITHGARVLFEAPDTDLAFLRIDTVNLMPCDSHGLNVFRLTKSTLTSAIVGQQLAIIGHPVLSQSGNVDIPVMRTGTIASTEISWTKPMLLLDLVGVPGFSGSPVILQSNGEVIGIVFGPGPTERAFGFEWATPISYFDYEVACAADIRVPR